MQTSRLHGPVHSELLDQLQGQLIQLQSSIPQLEAEYAVAENEVQCATARITNIQEEMDPLLQRQNAANAALNAVHATLPLNPYDYTGQQVREINFWRYELNQVSYPLVRMDEQLAYEQRRLQRNRGIKHAIRRRRDIIAWREAVVAAMSNPAQMTSFPLPPRVGRCRDASHDDPVCVCHIRAAFYVLNGMVATSFAAEREMFNPCRFSCCGEVQRAVFKRMAKAVSTVLPNMQREMKRM